MSSIDFAYSDFASVFFGETGLKGGLSSLTLTGSPLPDLTIR